MMRASALALIMLGAFSTSAHATGLEATQTVELATVTLTADGTESITYTPATDVEPGEQVRYSLSYSNQGADAADSVSLVMPVPAEVTYLEGSVERALSDVTFSVDSGETFYARDALMIGNGEAARLAAADEITHIKWDFSEPIAPSATGRIGFSAVLK